MKVAIFVGREHHALKLSALYGELGKRGHDVIYVYTTNSINIDPTAEFISNYGKNVHLHHYLDEALSRERWQMVDSLSRWSANLDLLRVIAPFWIQHSIEEAVTNIILSREYMAQDKPDAVVALHANNFAATPFLYAAYSAGVPTYAYQEGILRHRDQKTLNKQQTAADFVTTLFTWSQSDVVAYTKAGVEESVVRPVGPFHLDRWLNADRQEVAQSVRAYLGRGINKQLVSFLPPQIARYEGNLEETLVTLNKYYDKQDVDFVVKLHPFDYNSVDAVKEMGLTVYTEVDPSPLILASDYVLGQHSTTAIESMFLRVPFLEVDLQQTGIEQSLAAVPTVTGLEQITIDQSCLLQMEAWVKQNGSAADGRATERAVNIIEAQK